ncbi:hypothetical protein CR513_57968, partial [Mucuna pruriens]
MRLNPDKYVFGVQGGKFLLFMLTHRGIESNLDKCEAIINMKIPWNLKEAKYEALLAGLDLELEDSLLLRYYDKVINTLQNFDAFEVKHIPREDNLHTEILSKLVTTKAGQHRTTFHRIVKSLVTRVSKHQLRVDVTHLGLLDEGNLPDDKVEAAKVRRRSSWYLVDMDELHRRAFLHTPTEVSRDKRGRLRQG